MKNYEYIIASLPDLTAGSANIASGAGSTMVGSSQAAGGDINRGNEAPRRYDSQAPDVEGIIAEIRERLAGGSPTQEQQEQGQGLAQEPGLAHGSSDLAAMQTVLDGFDSGKLTPAFYAAALASKNGFIRDYFLFDLNVRNSKVAFLNEEIGRPEGTDIMYPCAEAEDTTAAPGTVTGAPATISAAPGTITAAPGIINGTPGTVTAAPDGCMYEPGDYDEEPQVRAVLKGSDILGRERGIDDIMWAKVEQLTTLHVFDLDIILGYLVRLKIMDRWLKLDPATGRELFTRLVAEIREKR